MVVADVPVAQGPIDRVRHQRPEAPAGVAHAHRHPRRAQERDGVGEVGVEEPILPAGLKGKVLAVDSKWNFVVLDVGEKQGALKNGVLMISRNTKLVAKVKIASLEGERSIANIIPGWDLAEVREGDQALY